MTATPGKDAAGEPGAPDDERARQQRYYARTVERYDSMHVNERDEHFFALTFLRGAIEHLDVRSVLDVGAGTGRAVRYLKQSCPGVRVVGVEPVAELRAIAHQNGLTPDELMDGDALHLRFPDGAFDVVCAFGILHHIRTPSVAVGEMLRVASRALFISDSNNFGQGRGLTRAVKQVLDAFRLWPLANLVKTRGRGYAETEGDGIAYSYSVFNDYPLIRSSCRSVHVLNTSDGGTNPYRTAGHVAVLGVKSPQTASR